MIRTPVTLAYRFSGTVTCQQGNSYGGLFSLGTSVSGWYCFDSTAEDFNSNPILIQTIIPGRINGVVSEALTACPQQVSALA